MKVKEIMSSNVISISAEETAEVAARLLARYNIGALPVCGKNGAIRGMVTDRDIVLRCIASREDPASTRVSEIMTRRVISVSQEEELNRAMELMAGEQIRRLPVEKEGKLVGMLSLGDLAKTREYTVEAANALCEISENMRRL